MKERAFAIATIVMLSILAAAGPAHAQESVMVVDIPFEFIVANTTLPAGEYAVERTIDGGSAILLVNRTDGHASVIFLTNAVQSKDWPSESSLVFNRYGNQYFLSKIWTAGSRLGRELNKSHREKELARLETKGEVALVARLSKVNR